MKAEPWTKEEEPEARRIFGMIVGESGTSAVLRTFATLDAERAKTAALVEACKVTAAFAAHHPECGCVQRKPCDCGYDAAVAALSLAGESK